MEHTDQGIRYRKRAGEPLQDGGESMRRKQAAAAATALLLALLAPGAALAGPSGASGADGGAEEERLLQLNDGLLEYSELPDLVERYNVTYKNTFSQTINQSQNLEAARQLGKDANQVMEDALDLKDDDMDEATRALYESYRDTAREMRKQAAKISNEDISGTTLRSMKMLKNQQTMLAQSLMIQYQEALSKKELTEKEEELAKASYDAVKAQAELGMASQEQVLAANQAWLKAQSAVTELDSTISSLKQNLLITCGWDADSDPQIAPLPQPDPARVDSLDVAADTETATEASYTLMSLRQSAASGSVSRNAKKRNVSQARQGIAVSMQGLYAKAVSARQAYEGAEADFQAASMDMQAADQKNAMGMMSRVDYLQAQVNYLTAKAARDAAQIELFSSLETYDWAVKGMIASGS